jgi:hypothetical protein
MSLKVATGTGGLELEYWLYRISIASKKLLIDGES